MFKLTSRSIAVVAVFALVSPFAALAMDGEATAPQLTSQAVAAVAPVSVIQLEGETDAPSLVDMILGFLHSSAQAAPAPAPEPNSAGLPEPYGRGAGLDPMGQSAN